MALNSTFISNKIKKNKNPIFEHALDTFIMFPKLKLSLKSNKSHIINLETTTNYGKKKERNEFSKLSCTFSLNKTYILYSLI